MTYNPRLDATTKEAEKMTKRFMRNWHWERSRHRTVRAVAAILVALGIGVGASGCISPTQTYNCMSAPQAPGSDYNICHGGGAGWGP